MYFIAPRCALKVNLGTFITLWHPVGDCIMINLLIRNRNRIKCIIEMIECFIPAYIKFYVKVESIMTYPDLIPFYYYTLALVYHHATWFSIVALQRRRRTFFLYCSVRLLNTHFTHEVCFYYGSIKWARAFVPNWQDNLI